MKNLLAKHINGTKIFILFILTNIIYVTMLTVTVPKVMSYTGGMKLLDLLPTGYDTAYVNSLFAALGEEGRNAYLFQQIPLDFIYPFLFGITYTLLFYFILNKLGKQHNWPYFFTFLPIISCLFDCLENIGIVVMLKNYPIISELIAQVTSIFTIVKSASTSIYFVALTIAHIALLLKYINLGKQEVKGN